MYIVKFIPMYFLMLLQIALLEKALVLVLFSLKFSSAGILNEVSNLINFRLMTRFLVAWFFSCQLFFMILSEGHIIGLNISNRWLRYFDILSLKVNDYNY